MAPSLSRDSRFILKKRSNLKVENRKLRQLVVKSLLLHRGLKEENERLSTQVNKVLANKTEVGEVRAKLEKARLEFKLR